MRQRFIEILNDSPLIVWALNKDGVYTVSEGKPLERMGFRSGDLVGRNHFEIFKDYESANAPIRRALAGETLRAESDFDGNIFSTHYVPVKDALGEVIGVTAVSTDVTELKSAQLEVFSERENLRALFKQTPEMVCIMRGPEHLFEFVNEAHVTVLGFDATGKTVREAQPESVEIHGILDNVYRTGETACLHEIAVTIGKKLRYFDLTYSARRDIHGRINGVMLLGSEVTHQVETRDSLSATAAKLRTISDTMPQIAWSANPNGDVTYANKKWYEFTGISETETMGFGFGGVIHPDDREQSLLSYRSALTAATPLEISHRMRARDGSYRWFLIRALPHKDENGRVTDWFGACTDIDAQKQIEQALAESALAAKAASEMKSAFLANMSHEIRTPLGAILGFTDLLRDSDLSAEDREQFLETISRNGQALTKIIDDILDLSKVEAGKLQIEEIEFSLPDILSEVQTLLEDRARAKGISVKLNWDSQIPSRIWSDPVRLRQILINILGNAIKFTSKGGVDISVQATPKDQKHQFKIAVADTGIGLLPDQLDNLFQPFTQADSSTTRKFGGTGLGLVLSRRLAQALGGDISVKANAPNGSVFTISFTARAEGKAAKTSAASPNGVRGPLSGLKVLVVDDSPDNRTLIQVVLSRRGAQVLSAENGRKALDAAKSEEVDVILMDIQMPGMDGYEATRLLRTSGFKKPIVALTAHAMAEERERTRAAGCDAHLTKPLDFDELVGTLEKFTSPIGKETDSNLL